MTAVAVQMLLSYDMVEIGFMLSAGGRLDLRSDHLTCGRVVTAVTYRAVTVTCTSCGPQPSLRHGTLHGSTRKGPLELDEQFLRQLLLLVALRRDAHGVVDGERPLDDVHDDGRGDVRDPEEGAEDVDDPDDAPDLAMCTSGGTCPARERRVM